MERHCRDQRPKDRRAELQIRIWGSRASLVIGTIAYLGLAALSVHMRPNEPFIASIWIFLAAHSAAYMVVKEVRGYDDDKVS
jgi:Zn-dependent protease